MINWQITLFVGKKQIQNNGRENSVAIVMSMLTYTAQQLLQMFLDTFRQSRQVYWPEPKKL